MRRAWILLVTMALTGTAALGQQTPVRGRDRVQLEVAINKEVIDGDLAGAMAIYRALSESPERPVKAQAILRLGQAYKRAGDPQATRMFERALEFADVPHVVTSARAALGRSDERQAVPGAVKTLMVNNRAMNIEFPAVSPDGRLLAYTDYNGNANVVVRDLSTGLTRTVTSDGAAPGKEAYYKSFSKDGRWLAYEFQAGNLSELRIVDLATQGAPSPRVLMSQTDRSMTPYDWSSDGKRLAAQTTGSRQQAAQLGYVTLADKQFHVIRSIQWLGSSRLSMSPDGAYLAYDNRADDTGERDIYVVSTDGKVEAPIARHRGNDTVVGWAADGRHVLFLSERGGTSDLYAQPMRSGRANGNAVLLRREVTGTPAGITSAGDVVFEVDPSTEAVYAGNFDRASGRVTLARTKPIRGLRPDWIAGSGSIAHAVERSRSVLAVTTIATGKTREMTLSELQYLQEFSVGPDGRSVIAKGAAVQSGAGLFVIDLSSGDVKPIALTPGRPAPELWQMPTWWRGTSSVAYVRVRTIAVGRGPGIREAGPDEPNYVERNLATGEVRELFSFGKEPWSTFGASPSPDRRFLVSRSPARGEAPGARGGGAYTNDSKSHVYLHTLATGESRALWEAPFAWAFAGPPQWLPDNSGVIVMRYTGADTSRLEAWLVPIDGTVPRRLDLGVQNLLPGGVRLSPDGRQLLMMVGDSRDGEIQAIERIVPGSKR